MITSAKETKDPDQGKVSYEQDVLAKRHSRICRFARKAAERFLQKVTATRSRIAKRSWVTKSPGILAKRFLQRNQGERRDYDLLIARTSRAFSDGYLQKTGKEFRDGGSIQLAKIVLRYNLEALSARRVEHCREMGDSPKRNGRSQSARGGKTLT